MADTSSRHIGGERFDETRLHNDFRRYHTLIGMRGWVTVSDTEQRRLSAEIDTITDRWNSAPSPWKDHWEHLNAAAHEWEHHPETMQRRIDGIAADYARTGTTDLASPIQIRSLIVAGELVQSRRSDLGMACSPETPDHIDYAYGYLTSFRTAGHGTTWKSLPSWSTARQWLIAQAADIEPQTLVDITITGPDPLSGAAARPLMTGTNLTARELGDQLRYIDELLGTTPIPVDPSAHSWLDELRSDVLFDAYRDTLLEYANPWAVGRRFEHYLRADDLFTDIVGYAEQIGLQNAGQRLDAIWRSTREHDIQWRTPPRPDTWLDEAVSDAQRRLGEFEAEGIALTYTDPAVPNRLTVLGFADKSWYIQHAHVGEDGRTVVYDAQSEPHLSCDELLSALGKPAPGPTLTSVPPTPVPDAITSRLRTFDRDLGALRRDVSTASQLQQAIRRGSPYTFRPNHQSSARTEHAPQRRTAIGRDANRITLTSTPVGEEPTAPAEPKKPMRTRRQQPPKSTGRQNRRHL